MLCWYVRCLFYKLYFVVFYVAGIVSGTVFQKRWCRLLYCLFGFELIAVLIKDHVIQRQFCRVFDLLHSK